MAIEWSLSVGLHAAAGGRSTHFVAPAGCSPEPADGTALFAPPALGADGTLYVGSGDGWLYAITDASTAASPR
jgi:outer membrane protein assembly factor BamB